MKLKVKDRFTLLGLLPKEGNLIQLRLIQELHALLGFSSEELVKFGIKAEGNNLNWSAKADKGIEVQFTEPQLQVFKDRFSELNRTSKLSLDHLSVHDLIMGEESGTKKKRGRP